MFSGLHTNITEYPVEDITAAENRPASPLSQEGLEFRADAQFIIYFVGSLGASLRELPADLGARLDAVGVHSDSLDGPYEFVDGERYFYPRGNSDRILLHSAPENESIDSLISLVVSKGQDVVVDGVANTHNARELGPVGIAKEHTAVAIGVVLVRDLEDPSLEIEHPLEGSGHYDSAFIHLSLNDIRIEAAVRNLLDDSRSTEDLDFTLRECVLDKIVEQLEAMYFLDTTEEHLDILT